jgi:hypothetical protein
MSEINLKSDTGADYSKLRDFLKNQQWLEADQETLFIMQKILPFTDEGGFVDENFVGDMSQFPCMDLQAIDQLWVKYSNGHFGFSVQKAIWEKIGGNLDKDFDDGQQSLLLDVFSPQVGWKIDDFFPSPFELNFSLDAPQGELPATWVNSDSVVAADRNIFEAWKRLKICQIA